MKADGGEILLLERTWNDPKEDKDERRFPSSCTVQSKLCLLIIAEGNHANDVPLSKVNLLASGYDFSELHKPQKELEDSNFCLTFSEPLLKASYHKHKPFKD